MQQEKEMNAQRPTPNGACGKLLVVQAAALGFEFLREHGGPQLAGLQFEPLNTVFPAVTATAQATLRTASAPTEHGMVGNGFHDRTLNRVLFWEQSANLVAGKRIWDAFRANGRTVGMLCWQQSMGEAVDAALSPAPVHKHGGGIIDTCWSRPAGLYTELCNSVGRRFRLRDYWGPLASARSSAWIADATVALLRSSSAPDLCLTYLPALDYDLQRYGTRHPRSVRALNALAGQLDRLRAAATEQGYAMVVFGDYAIADCSRPVYPNRALADAGLLVTRTAAGGSYLDVHSSRAFAVVDHELAHVTVRDPSDMTRVAGILHGLEGVEAVLDGAAQRDLGIAHDRSGDLVAVAADESWFAYPWWTGQGAAPDYASHVDIHNKPGFDPCELFLGWPPGSIGRDPKRVGGSHGKTGPGRETAWATVGIELNANSLASLGEAVLRWLEHGKGN